MFKFYAIILSTLFAGSSAYGFSASRLFSVPKMNRTQLVKACTDFTGTWVGTCEDTNNGEVEESDNALTISQDQCASFTVDNETYEFGVAKTTTESDTESTSTIVVTPNWANNNTTIAATMKLTGNSLPPSPFQYSYSGSFKVTFDIVDGKLISKSAGKTSFKIEGSDEVIDGESSSVCTYEKQ